MTNSKKMKSARKTVPFDDVEVDDLTIVQAKLLALFLNDGNRTVGREEIINKVWAGKDVRAKTIDVHLYNLRRKLNPFGYFIRSEGQGRWSLRSSRIDHNQN